MKTVLALSALMLSTPAKAQVGAPPPPSLVLHGVAPTDLELAEGILAGRNDRDKGAAVVMSTVDGLKKLASVPGTLASTWAYFVVLIWADFPEMHSALRVSDPAPSFFVTMEQTPKNRLFLVRCRVNHRTRDRSVKMGQAGVFTYRGISAPDVDWTFPFDAREVKPGLWKLTPHDSLPPGEYGLFSGAAAPNAAKGNPAGELFEFAIDKPS
jgi:hypothetical protein